MWGTTRSLAQHISQKTWVLSDTALRTSSLKLTIVINRTKLKVWNMEMVTYFVLQIVVICFAYVLSKSYKVHFCSVVLNCVLWPLTSLAQCQYFHPYTGSTHCYYFLYRLKLEWNLFSFVCYTDCAEQMATTLTKRTVSPIPTVGVS